MSFRGQDDAVCAELKLQDGSLVSGPFRFCLKDAQRDLDELRKRQKKSGDQAALEELRRRDLNAMARLLQKGP